MTIFKNIKDGKLYFIHVVINESGKVNIALPINNEGESIINCDRNYFIIEKINKNKTDKFL